MDEKLTVAIVGRPNVGKSRLFNRLVGKRLAIVFDQPGVTRDVMMYEKEEGYVLMDTGGIGMVDGSMTPEALQVATEEQVGFALEAATLVLFVVDAKDGLTPQDEIVAKHLRKHAKNTLLVLNKIDAHEAQDNLDAFHRLGFPSIAVSAEHGTHFTELEETILSELPPIEKDEDSDQVDTKKNPIRICFTGRPNVGKSSLVNALLKEDRLIVSEIAGTTRDSIRTHIDYDAPDGNHVHFELIDTAGLRPKTKVDSAVEVYSNMRTVGAIEDAHVVFLVLDALTGVTKTDKKIAGEILEAGRGLVVVVNKWDHAVKQFQAAPLKGYDTERDFRTAFVKAVRKELFFLPASPVIFTSAKENQNIPEILRRAKAVNERMHRKLATGKVNILIRKLLAAQKPRSISGKRFKIYYATQVGNFPLKFKVFCNFPLRLDDSYERYLESSFVEAFKLNGCPIHFDLVGKKNLSSSSK